MSVSRRELAGMSILLVDDSNMAQLALLLQRLGAVVLTSRAVEDAQMQLQNHRNITAVLMDHHLAGVQVGTQLARWMRDQGLPALRISYSGKDAGMIVSGLPED